MPLSVHDLFHGPPLPGRDVPGDGRHGTILRDASDRLWIPFNVVFGALAILSTLIAIFDADADPWRRWAGLPLVALAFAGYGWLIRPFRTGARPGSWRAVAWCAMAVTVLTALLFVHPGYWFTSFAVFFQLWIFLPFGFAAIASAGLSLVLWIQPGLAEGNGIDLSPVGLAVFTVSVVVSTMLGLLITVIARQSGERLALVRQLQAERAARLDAEREAGALAERTRLSRDLHDTLAQDLISIVMQLETAATVMPDAGPGRAPVEDAARIARAGLDEVRRLLWALRPSQLGDASVAGALERLAATWSTEHGVRAAVRWDGETIDLPPAVEVTLLRVTQEALANVTRHAAATTVDIVVTVFDDAIHLDIRDDGRGFDPAAPVRSASAGAGGERGGLGLVGMRERVAAIRGTLAVESAPGIGTTVAVTIPRIGMDAEETGPWSFGNTADGSGARDARVTAGGGPGA
ncbi:MAG TPA: sensor histidine kinase [Thermomicrobiales bacterium]|jgi:signal transduction histidine kinase|nr:sensor histidine kinase [Thermomicrobiales bacterium]